MKVIASIYSTFLQRGFDNLFHDVCLQELPVVFAIDRAGLAGPDGSTHNGIYDISFLNAMPNMVISQPRNGQLLKELLESAHSWGRPAAIRYPNVTTDDATGPLLNRELGKGEILKEGKEILLIGLGNFVFIAEQVRELLQPYGITATVFDPIFVKPLDSEALLQLLSTHSRVVTMEDHSAMCGLGAILNHFLMMHGYSQIQTLNIGIPEAFIEQGTHAQLHRELGLTADKIAQRIVQQFSLAKAPTCLILPSF